MEGLTSIHRPLLSVKRTQKGSDLEVTSRSSRFWPLTDSSTLHTQYWEPMGAAPAAGAPGPCMWAMGGGGGGGNSSWQSAGIGVGCQREGTDIYHTTWVERQRMWVERYEEMCVCEGAYMWAKDRRKENAGNEGLWSMCSVCLWSYSLLWSVFTYEIHTAPSCPSRISNKSHWRGHPRHSFYQENLGFSRAVNTLASCG